jgi:hypothetical protein
MVDRRLSAVMVDLGRPKRWDRTPSHDLEVPQLVKPRGVLMNFDGTPLEAGDDFFRPAKITARVGETVTGREAAQRLGGKRPVRGTYRRVCMAHPTTRAQTLEVK